MRKQFFIILAIIFSQSFIFANLGNGSDGALNIGSFDEQSIGLATSVISAGGNIIEVADASFLGSGDEVLIITMIDSNLNLDENTDLTDYFVAGNTFHDLYSMIDQADVFGSKPEDFGGDPMYKVFDFMDGGGRV